MASQTVAESRASNEYTVGWVCALPKEQTAATAMLDQRHATLPKPPSDPNTYTLGSIGKHNIVIACLPKGQISNNSADTVVSHLISTFPSIKVSLMVGIGGGIPPKVRLGDVVVSTPVSQYPGVVQWDFGKANDDGKFEWTSSLNNPPSALLTALTQLETEHELNGSKVPEYLAELGEKWPRLASKYLRSNSLNDVLFRANYSHVNESVTNCDITPDVSDVVHEGDEEESCQFCDKTKVVKRKPRDMRVHYGLIASGNQVIKDATFRDKLNKDLSGHVLCVEMEAAGIMNNFPCIVIRGICDYADSHKNKAWQEHAAAVAAAFAKELLTYVQPSDVDNERTTKDILNEVQQVKKKLEDVHEQVQEGFRRAESGLGSLLGERDRQTANMILDWLTPVDYGSQQSDYLRRRQQGTGQWLLDSVEYQAWLNLRKQTLFCPGIPGAGKTIITSIVVSDLIARFKDDPTIGIAYIYCNFRRKHEQKIDDMLATLLRQLLCQGQSQSSLPKTIQDLYDKHKRKGSRLSLDEISSALHPVVALYSRVRDRALWRIFVTSRVFIVVDALDECQVSEGHRSKFLSEIFALQQKFEANIFATSRFILQVSEKFKGHTSLEIRAHDDDVRKYLEGRISQSDRKFVKTFQEEIKTEITKAVDGMFLLAQLLFDSIETKTTLLRVERALKNLPTGPDAYGQVYEDAMERINGQVKDFKELANNVLSWIVCAKKPLTAFELQHALAIEDGESKVNENNLSDIEDMVSVCAGLVVVDEESSIIRLVHFTTQEYFERTQKQWLPNAGSEITRSCITYLSFDTFEDGFCNTDYEFEERLRLNRLYDYAARNWGCHARESSTSPEEVIGFLKCEAKVEASSQVLMVNMHSSRIPYYSQRLPRQSTGVHLAAYFGLSDTALSLLMSGHDPDQKNTYGQTPLWWAAKNGCEAVVKLLLEKAVDVESKDNEYGRTLLSWAARNGHEAVVKLLLEKAVDVDSKDSNGRTPLSWAARNGHEAVVKPLLEKAVDVDSKDNNGQTPLSWAVGNGHEAVVKLLLEKAVDVDSKDNNKGQTLLSWAAANGREAVVKLLKSKIQSQ